MPDSWYIAINGAKVGPLTLQGLKATLATFSNAKDMLVLRDGLTDWKPARDLPELGSQTAPPPPLPPAPSVRREAMRSQSSALSDIRPNGSFATIEEKAKHSTAPPITTANVIGAFAILAIFVFAFAMGKRNDSDDGTDRGNNLLSANAELPPAKVANQIAGIPKVTEKVTPTARALSRDAELVVSMSVTATATNPPTIIGRTNLPDGTILDVKLFGDPPACIPRCTIWLPDNAIVKNGRFSAVAGARSPTEAAPMLPLTLFPGSYTVDISMSAASAQPPNVQSVIGEKGGAPSRPARRDVRRRW
jgi:hypothetical protein